MRFVLKKKNKKNLVLFSLHCIATAGLFSLFHIIFICLTSPFLFYFAKIISNEHVTISVVFNGSQSFLDINLPDLLYNIGINASSLPPNISFSALRTRRDTPQIYTVLIPELNGASNKYCLLQCCVCWVQTNVLVLFQNSLLVRFIQC